MRDSPKAFYSRPRGLLIDPPQELFDDAPKAVLDLLARMRSVPKDDDRWAFFVAAIEGEDLSGILTFLARRPARYRDEVKFLLKNFPRSKFASVQRNVWQNIMQAYM